MTQRLTAIAACLLALGLLAACTATQTPGQAMDDQALATRLESRLAADPQVSAYDITVDVSGRVATLSGTVESREVAQAALDIASETRGITGVIDRIERPEDQGMVDARITEAVQARLQGTQGLDASGIAVSTEAGVVTLSGTVATHEARETARVVARETDGVARVRDALRVAQGD